MILTPHLMAQMIDTSLLVQSGAMGTMLLWFMFRAERKLDDHTNVISDLAKSILLDVLSRDKVSDKSREEADDVMQRITLRESKRK